MNAGAMSSKVRQYVGDMTKVKYSDFEIMSCINDAVRLLVLEVCNTETDDFRESTELDVDPDTGAVLPTGFYKGIKAFDSRGKELLRTHEVTPSFGEYTFKADKLYSRESSVNLLYYGFPAQISILTDEVDIPEDYTQPVMRAVGYLLQGNNSAALQTIQYYAGTSPKASGKDDVSREG